MIFHNPWKTNMEPKHGGGWKMFFSLYKGWFLGSMLNFGGVWKFKVFSKIADPDVETINTPNYVLAFKK